MAEPKKRLTNTRSGNRQSHLSYKAKSLSSCPSCKSSIVPHHVCPNCGKYKGEQILNFSDNNKKNKSKD